VAWPYHGAVLRRLRQRQVDDGKVRPKASAAGGAAGCDALHGGGVLTQQSTLAHRGPPRYTSRKGSCPADVGGDMDAMHSSADADALLSRRARRQQRAQQSLRGRVNAPRPPCRPVLSSSSIIAPARHAASVAADAQPSARRRPTVPRQTPAVVRREPPAWSARTKANGAAPCARAARLRRWPWSSAGRAPGGPHPRRCATPGQCRVPPRGPHTGGRPRPTTNARPASATVADDHMVADAGGRPPSAQLRPRGRSPKQHRRPRHREGRGDRCGWGGEAGGRRGTQRTRPLFGGAPRLHADLPIQPHRPRHVVRRGLGHLEWVGAGEPAACRPPFAAHCATERTRKACRRPVRAGTRNVIHRAAALRLPAS